MSKIIEKKPIDLRNDLYLIVWPGKTAEDCIEEVCHLGRFTYPKVGNSRKCVFTKLEGFSIMEYVISKDRMDILEHTKIISNNGREYTVENFLNTLDGVEIR